MLNKAEHKYKTISSIKWNLYDQIFSQAILFVINIILMRLIAPNEFGLLGLVTVFTGFFNVVKDFGFSSSLIYEKKIDEIDKNTIFFVSVFVGFMLCLILILASHLIAEFYHQPKIVKITIVLSTIYIVQSFSLVQQALYRKQLEFKILFIINSISIFFSGLIALILAYSKFGIWALVTQQISYAGLTSLLFYVFSPFKPKLMFSFKVLKKHLNYSLPLMGKNALNYWSRNADNFFIGKFLGSQALGLYSRAYAIMMFPISKISGVVGNVLFPSFALIQEDTARIRAIFLKIADIILFITLPLMIYVYFFAFEIVKFLFGHNWLPMVTTLKILSIVAILQSIGTFFGVLFLSLGKTKLMFKINIIASIFYISVFYIGAHYSIEAVSKYYLLATLIIMSMQYYFIGNLIKFNIIRFGKYLTKFIAPILFILIIFKIIRNIFIIKNIIFIILVFIIIIIFWIFVNYIFNKSLILDIITLIKNFKKELI